MLHTSNKQVLQPLTALCRSVGGAPGRWRSFTEKAWPELLRKELPLNRWTNIKLKAGWWFCVLEVLESDVCALKIESIYMYWYIVLYMFYNVNNAKCIYMYRIVSMDIPKF